MNQSIDSLLVQAVHQSQPHIVDLCRRLIQTPSVNGVDPERHAAEVIAAEAENLGLHAQIVGMTSERPNVIISTAPTGKTGLLLLGHLDTVPAGDPVQWTYPPFAGEVVDGRIYGRGAIDTKGGMSAALYALAALAQTPGSLVNGRAQLVCFPDEESGATGTLGIKYLHNIGLLEGLGAIYAYSGDQITLGHRGLLRYKITAHGQAIHTGAYDWQEGVAGANAVTGMARLLLELESLKLPYSTTRYFEDYRTIITAGTMISGGVSVNVVPDLCEALLDIRLTPEYDQKRIEALIEDCITRVSRKRLRFSSELLSYAAAAITDDQAVIVQELEAATVQIKGHRTPRVVAGPANEGYLLIERGIPTICGFGPTGANAHAVDEYAEISGLVDAAAIFALTAWWMSHYS